MHSSTGTRVPGYVHVCHIVNIHVYAIVPAMHCTVHCNTGYLGYNEQKKISRTGTTCVLLQYMCTCTGPEVEPALQYSILKIILHIA